MITKQLKKYRHIIAALIEQSLGRFSPIDALKAVLAHKNKENFNCELYLHLANNRIKFFNDSDTNFEKLLLKVNADSIKAAFKWRHTTDLSTYLNIVDENIAAQVN